MAETTVSVEREAAVSLSAAVLERSESLALDRRTGVRLVATTAPIDGIAVELDVAASGNPEGGTTVVAEARDVGDDDSAATDEQLRELEREFVAALESAVGEESVVRREASADDGDADRRDGRAAAEPDAGADSVGEAAADAAAEWPLADDGDEREDEDPDANADDDGSGLSVKVLVFLIFLLSIVAALALVALVFVPA